MSKHDFHRNFAIIIGINNYQNSIRKLITAVPDALKLAEIIQKQHENLKPQYQAQNKYEVQLLLNQRASLSQLKQLIADFKQGQITLERGKVTVTERDRLLFYFAGHGIALDALENQEGPVGYLIPQDAISGDSSTYLPMQELHDALNALPCRHLLAILDCCFAGAFRWASLKREVVRKVQIYKERYDRFISDRAWQVITSASDDQKALDSLGSRGRATDGNEIHSPFAKALFDVLLGKGGDSNQDGMVTATELYSYLRDQVEIASENYYQRQTPSLCPLRKHDKGEFIFLLPEFDRDKLEDAPPLNVENNPYRGLSSYDEKDSDLFFGREEQIQKLYQKVADNKQQLTLVLGASGTGKSSLVKAGLIPKLRKDDKTWRILPPFRPGESPLKSLNNVLESVKQPLIQAGTSSRLFTPAEESLGNWFKNNPQAKLLVIIDQFEELITLSKSEEAEKFQIFIKNILVKYANNIHVVITLRLDFEAQFQNSVLNDFWNNDARFVVAPMSQNEFRQAIEKPALEKVLYFDPPSLVDELINEVVQMPGALPLLSFTLSELYLKYLGDRTRDNRALTKKDYEELGRVVGSLTQRANQEYENLVKENSAYQDTVRRVMLRMISLQGGELARRQVPKSELVYSAQEENKRVQTVIKRFSEARLIVEGSNAQGESYVEPAHDALVQGWDQLLAWKKENEENIILQRRLTPDAEEWKSIKAKFQPLGLQTKAKTAIDWFDHRLYTIENSLTKIPSQFARLWKRSQNQQKHYGEKPVQFLWDANPYLDIVAKEISSDDNWLNQVEADFVEESVLQKRRNTSWRWRIAIAVMLGLSGLSIATLIGQRNAQIGQIRASRESAEANFRANEHLNALVDSLRAAKNFKQVFWPKPSLDLQNQVGQTLRNIVYGAKETDRWPAPPGIIFSIFFTSNGQLLVITNDNGKVCLWNQYGECLELKEQKGLLRGGISVSPDGSKIATATETGTVRLWDWQGNKSAEFQAHQGNIEYIKFSPDGNTIATVADKAVRLSDLQGNKIKEQNLTQRIIGLGFKSSGELLVATLEEALEEGNIRVLNWSGENFQEEAGFKNTYSSLTIEVSFSPDGKQAMVFHGEESENADLWNFSEDSKPNKNNKIDGIRSGSFSSDGKQLARTGIDGKVYLQNANVGSQFKLPQGIVQMSTFSPDGKQIVTVGDDNIIRLWDIEQQPLSKASLDQKNIESISFSSISFSPDGRTIATADSEGVVRLLDLQGNPIKEFTELPKVTSVSFSPDGRTIATTGDGGMVRLLDLQGNQKNEFKAHPGKVTSVTWRQDGQEIATIGDADSDPDNQSQTSDDTLVRFWDTKGNPLEKQQKSTNTFGGVSFRANDKPLLLSFVSNSGDAGAAFSNVNLLDFSGRSTNFIQGRQAGNVFNLVKISQDGSLILTTSQNENTISLWNLKGEKLMEFSGNGGNIKSLSLNPDNSMLAVITKDGNAELWRLGNFDELLSKGCDRIRDYLQNNPNVNESDRHLCDHIPPITTKPKN
ncbi:caspase family protein [Aulosira sp. FACHB-615]|uniref:nSTAND1 domain-containing NTPase n=1 Tax=Aulosira sp. FACHB-615 TaxID=2692777 RepID=UPI001685F5EB|nr:caspase family protein [Aulosira sp. FACHB-615]MBD2492296.1 caspase family protein [Aulosira sp. FACHB-615]